jgi:gamma-glutamyltranspeptidase/glutathione hydrolase
MMRRDTGGTGAVEARNGRPRRQLRRLALIVPFLLSACGGGAPERENLANPAGVSGNRAPLSAIFRGGATFAATSADESRAAEVGRDVLLGGGNATDAAAAMYFAMAVTLPSAASLGASGVCIVHDSKTRAGEAFVFAPVAAPGGVRGTQVTVPSGARAITLMHTRHGSVPWPAVVAPAERLARLGVPVSRALSRDLQAGAVALGADGEARRVFGRGTGTAVTEGDNFIQTDLAATLGILRQRGGADLSTGSLARVVSDQIAQIGGSMPVEALRSAVPQAGPPAGESFGGFRVYVAPPPMAGAMALAGWNGKAGPTGPAPTDSGGISGLAAIDSKGGAAACSLSMGQLFGARVMVPNTGILLGTPTADSTSVSPLVIGNPGNAEVLFAGAGGGSPSAPYALGLIARGVVDKKQYVAAALTAHGGQGGYVNAIACPDGIRSGGASCNSGTDPAGSGLALNATPR